MLSVLLNLVCTGFFLILRTVAEAGSHDKPSLSAWPSHVVQLGHHVDLRCESHESYIFKLYKELGPPIPQFHGRIFHRSLFLGPVTPEYGGTYRCYNYNHENPNELSSHSDALKIIISGLYKRPSLTVLPTPLVNSGEMVTLKCHSEILFENFILILYKNETIKVSFKLSAESYLGGSHANFSIGPVTPHHAGTYICYGSYKHTPYEWSESSDPVDIKITGLYKKPSLSALMGPVVMSGENVTLSCVSDLQFDMFHLFRSEVPQGHGVPAVQSHNGTFQANFLLVSVIQAGTYRCYGFFRNHSHVWSTPSDPLYLPVTVNSSRNNTLCTELDSKTYNHRNTLILFGLSVTKFLVFLIIILYSCSAKKSKSQEQVSGCHLSSVRNQDQRNTAIMDQDSEARTTLNRQSSPRPEDVFCVDRSPFTNND